MYSYKFLLFYGRHLKETADWNYFLNRFPIKLFFSSRSVITCALSLLYYRKVTSTQFRILKTSFVFRLVE